MNMVRICAAIVGAASLLVASHAQAVPARCDFDPTLLQRLIDVLPGHSQIVITGNCVANITIATDDLSFVADPSGGSITGQVEVTAQRISFSGVDILGPEPSDGTIVRGGLFAHDGASVSFSNAAIANHTANGILAVRNASVVVVNSHILGNGTAGVANNAAGVQVLEAASVLLGALDANNDPIPASGVEIANNSGQGIEVSRNGALRLAAGTIHDNGAQAVVAAFGGSIRMAGATISAPTPPVGLGPDAVEAILSGSIDIENTSGNPVGRTFVSGSNGGVFASDGGTVRIRGATITTSGGPAANPAVGSFRTSFLRLVGDTVITNSGSGFGLEVGDGASLRLDNGSTLGLPAVPNQLTGTVLVFNNGELRVSDPGADITGNISVDGNSLLALNSGTITGNITLLRPSTLTALVGPINFTGTLLCQNGGTQFVVGTPNPFVPPLTACNASF
jgi:hypothetical protein